MLQCLALVSICSLTQVTDGLLVFPDTPLRCSLVAEATVVELFREDPSEDLGLRIVGGKDTPLGNIVIQEIVRDSLVARDGKLAPGDHILEVRHISTCHAIMFVLMDSLTQK